MKKILTLLLTLLLLTMYLCSCSLFHECSFGEWETTLAFTCTTDGRETRFCKCGESQSQSITKHHQFTNGICDFCKESRAYMLLTEFVVKKGDYDSEKNTYALSGTASSDSIATLTYYPNEKRIVLGRLITGDSTSFLVGLHMRSDSIETYKYEYLDTSGNDMKGTLEAATFTDKSTLDYTYVSSNSVAYVLSTLIVPSIICGILEDFETTYAETKLTVKDIGFTSFVASAD